MTDYVRGEDVLDIWFDSGASWAAVLEGTSDLSLVCPVLQIIISTDYLVNFVRMTVCEIVLNSNTD